MKATSKKTIKTTVILYGVLLCLALVFILALFVFDRAEEGEAEHDMTLTAGGNLELSLDGAVFGQKQTPEYSCDCPPITGDGVQFYTSEGSVSEGQKLVDLGSRADRSEYYVDVVVHFRTSVSAAVYLQSSSFAKGVNMNTDGESGSSVPEGAIAGALRVAFYEIPADRVNDKGYQPTADDLRCIWIPNQNYEIDTDADGKQTFTNNGSREDAYGYLTSAADGSFGQMQAWNADDFASGKVAVGNTGLATKSATANGAEYIMANSATPLLAFEGGSEAETKTMMIRIWMEGTDREARERLDSDMVRYKFDFLAIEKQDPSSADVAALRSVRYDGEGGLMYGTEGYDFSDHPILYSYDGITWALYGAVNHPGIKNELYTDANGEQVLFVKLGETATEKPSGYHRVVIVPAASGGASSQ